MIKAYFILGLILLSSYSVFSKDIKHISDQQQDKQQRIQAEKRFKLKHTEYYYYELGKKLQNQGELREAVKNYEYAILLNSQYALPYFALGEIYFFLGQFQESISYTKKSLKMPFEFEFDKIKAHYLLIVNYFRNKQVQNALEILHRLTSQYQADIDRQAINGLNIKYEYYAPAFFMLTLYHRNEGDLDKNIHILQKSVQLGFKKEYSNYFFYEYYAQQGQHAIAWEYLKQAKEIDPQIEEHVKHMPFIKTYDIYLSLILK